MATYLAFMKYFSIRLNYLSIVAILDDLDFLKIICYSYQFNFPINLEADNQY